MAATARQEREMKMKYEQLKGKKDVCPLDTLRAFVLAQGVRGIKNISRCFKRIDQNNDNKIDFAEFKSALHMEGIYVDEAIERQCFEDMDLNKTGVLNFDEFLIALRPPMSNHRKSLINMAYNKLDKDGSGVVEANDLKGVYNGKKHPKYLSGEWTEEQVFGEWLNSFNGPDNFSGQVLYDEFENYYVGVSASIDSDAYFDLMMRQAWKL